jgi:hypothetical protein
MATFKHALAFLFSCLCNVVAARRSDTAHFTGQTKTPTHANTKGRHAEHLDTSRFASETAESEVCYGASCEIKRYKLELSSPFLLLVLNCYVPSLIDSVLNIFHLQSFLVC